MKKKGINQEEKNTLILGKQEPCDGQG